MEEDLEAYLKRVADDPKSGKPAKALAEELLEQWNLGVIPAPSAINRLRDLEQREVPCQRADHDGSCAWLRQFGAAQGIQVPPVGERAKCCFVGFWGHCPGYVAQG